MNRNDSAEVEELDAFFPSLFRIFLPMSFAFGFLASSRHPVRGEEKNVLIEKFLRGSGCFNQSMVR